MTVLASAADARYGWWLLNMVGSVAANSPVFERVVVYDLGLTRAQRRLLGAVRGVELRTIEPFTPQWAEGRTWKTWIWTTIDAERLMWLDAGLTVLRPLDEALARVEERGYFVVSQGHPIRDSIPSDYYDLYDFPRELGDRVSIAAGILAFDRTGWFYERVIVPTHEDCLAGRSIGFSPGDAARLNSGLDRSDAPLIRDCTHFRWDQTVLNLRFYGAVEDPVVDDLDRFAGWRSPHDHPEQVIWSHRRRGDFAYLPRVPYRWPLAPFARAFGAAFRWRWWGVNHSWYFRPSTYVAKARRLAGDRR
jgi:hypothetical protein